MGDLLSRQDSASLLNHYRRLIQARRSSPALMAGEIELPGEVRSILDYIRTHKTGDALVVYNLGRETVTLILKGWSKLNFRSENGVSFKRGVLTLPAGSTGILTGRKK